MISSRFTIIDSRHGMLFSNLFRCCHIQMNSIIIPRSVFISYSVHFRIIHQSSLRSGRKKRVFILISDCFLDSINEENRSYVPAISPLTSKHIKADGNMDWNHHDQPHWNMRSKIKSEDKCHKYIHEKLRY